MRVAQTSVEAEAEKPKVEYEGHAPCTRPIHGRKKKGSGTGSRGLALFYPGLPAPLDVNRSVNASSLDVGCAWTQKQIELRRSTARLEYLVRTACGGDGIGQQGARLCIGGARQDRGCTWDKGGGHVGSVQTAVNSLGANCGTVGRRSALAARLNQPSWSRLMGKRGAAAWASRRTDDAPPRHEGAARRARRGIARALRRLLSDIQRHLVLEWHGNMDRCECHHRRSFHASVISGMKRVVDTTTDKLRLSTVACRAKV